MGDNKPTYKEINGTTRVGDFLRSINKTNVLTAIGELATGDVAGAIAAITSSNLSDEDKQHALKMIELDVAEMNGVTARWSADMASDSYLSKNVRPLSLIFLTLTTMLLIYIDAFLDNVIVDDAWIDLLQSLLMTIFLAYFGSRGFEKYKAIGK